MSTELYLGGENGYTAKIRHSIERVRHEFIYIGLLLHEVNAYEYYREGGFDSVYDYAEKFFGFKKSNTNNFIRVYLTFGEGIGIQERYHHFRFSQLVEMCSMNSRALNCARPDMTVLELRQLKKIHSDADQVSVQTSGKNNVKLHYSGDRGDYDVPVWLTMKMFRYLNRSGDITMWDVMDAGLVSLFGCKSGSEF